MIPQLVLSFLPLALLSTLAESQLIYNFCETSSNFKANSTYETNLNHMFSSLTQNTAKTGFYTGTEGEQPYRVYGLALCRGDISDDFCTGCVIMASRYLPRLCPYNKGGIAWYDRCVVRYSHHDFFSRLDDDIEGFRSCLYQNASDPYQFKQQLVLMIDSLSRIAALNGSVHMFATGAGTGLYGMVQCTRDLSGVQCFKCLNQSLNSLLEDCCASVQAVALSGSCIMRYEMDQFFSSNPTWVAPANLDPISLPPVKPPAPGRPPKGNYNTSFPDLDLETGTRSCCVPVWTSCLQRDVLVRFQESYLLQVNGRSHKLVN
jgi:Salt stress response/antifungal